MKVLIAQHDALFRDFLEKSFKSRGYDVTNAETRDKAYGAIKTGEFSIAVIDATVPELEGIELCEKIRTELGDERLYILLIISKSRKEDNKRGLEAGANDLITKYISADELYARVQVGERVAKLENELLEKTAQLKAASERIEADMDEAAKIQKKLLPHKPPAVPHIDFSWHFKPCHAVGGDMLNVFRLDEDNLGIYVLDVCGHGIPAAMLSMSITSDILPRAGKGGVLKQYLPEGSGHRIITPGEAANTLNRNYMFHDTTSQYFTILFGIIGLKDLVFRYVRAGHPPPIVVSDAEAKVIKERVDLPMGLFPETEYVEQKIQLKKGERLYIISDGVSEAANHDNEHFGYKRLASALWRHYSDTTLEESIQAVYSEIESWHTSQKDDISIIGLEITADPA